MGDSRRRGTSAKEADATLPARIEEVVMPMVWVRRIGSGVSDILMVL